MKKMVMFILLLCVVLSCGVSFADTASSPAQLLPGASSLSAPGWGPSVVGSVGAFYFNGNYTLLSAGANFGSAYTWDQGTNVNSAGIYVGPQSSQTNGVTATSLNLMAYVNLYKTAAAGSFGVGLGTEMWASGKGMQAPTARTTFLALGYQF